MYMNEFQQINYMIKRMSKCSISDITNHNFVFSQISTVPFKCSTIHLPRILQQGKNISNLHRVPPIGQLFQQALEICIFARCIRKQRRLWNPFQIHLRNFSHISIINPFRKHFPSHIYVTQLLYSTNDDFLSISILHCNVSHCFTLLVIISVLVSSIP